MNLCGTGERLARTPRCAAVLQVGQMVDI